jgi:hypothetical protein
MTNLRVAEHIFGYLLFKKSTGLPAYAFHPAH